jgi:hypothetical protein
MNTRITAKDLEELKACRPGIQWFKATFPKGTTLETLVNTKTLCYTYAEWVATRLPNIPFRKRVAMIAYHTSATYAYITLITDCEHLTKREAIRAYKRLYAVSPTTANLKLAMAKTPQLSYKSRIALLRVQQDYNKLQFLAACYAADATTLDRLEAYINMTLNITEMHNNILHILDAREQTAFFELTKKLDTTTHTKTTA